MRVWIATLLVRLSLGYENDFLSTSFDLIPLLLCQSLRRNIVNDGIGLLPAVCSFSNWIRWLIGRLVNWRNASNYRFTRRVHSGDRVRLGTLCIRLNS